MTSRRASLWMRRVAAVAASGAAAAALLIPPLAAVSQPPLTPAAETAAGQSRAMPDGWYHASVEGRAIAGVDECVQCHGGSTDNPELERLGFRSGRSSWILGNEVLTWAKEDRHHQAYHVLLGERAKEMAQRMGVVDGSGASLVHRDRRCLACHAAVPVSLLEVASTGDGMELVPESLTEDLRLERGVHCEGCHGPSVAEEGEGWKSTHVSQQWRFRSAEEKLALGFWDVHGAANQTRICLSCHLGNVEQGKVVTHEMYAAGHPPLPGFEVMTFSTQEPRHWRDLAEKPANLREEFLMKTGLSYQESDLRRTRKLLAGAPVALAESLRLAAHLAAEQPPEHFPLATAKPAWPELAAFACYSCHHELAVPSWRQRREPPAGPGRPLLHEWPEALVRVAARFAGREKELDEKLGPVYAALAKQPFGRPSDLVPAANEAAEWADGLAAELEAMPLAAGDGWTMLASLAEAGQRAPDYDSARQLVWAFAVVHDELTGRDAPPPGAKFVGWYPEPEGDVEAVLASLAESFRLDLAAEGGACPPGLNEKPCELPLESTLKRIAEYDPTVTREAFARLAELLRRRPPAGDGVSSGSPPAAARGDG